MGEEPSDVLEKVLQPPVRLAEVYDDPPGLTLLGAEPEEMSRAVPARRREFTTVRWCARQALAGLGIGPVPILRGERGAPRWPAGVVGSMTHCAGYRAAAVARDSDVRSVGIDAESHLPLPEGVLDVIALPTELRRLADLADAEPAVHWDRLLFSTKEAVYKAWFPLTHRWLDFDQADITIGTDGTFRARLSESHPRVPEEGVSGRWLVDRGLLVTAITVV